MKIGEIVLVGGSSRIPKVKYFLKEYFDIREIIKYNIKHKNYHSNILKKNKRF